MSSGSVVGTMSTAIWLPFSASKADSLLRRSASVASDRVPV